MRLADGTLWPIPVVLDLPEDVAAGLGDGASLALRDPEGTMLAVLHVEEKWTPDRTKEVEQVYGTTDTKHPGVAHVLNGRTPSTSSGRLEGVEAPTYYDYRELRQTPAELRAEFTQARLAQDRRVPDAQPDAPRALRAHRARGDRDRARTCSSTPSSA